LNLEVKSKLNRLFLWHTVESICSIIHSDVLNLWEVKNLFQKYQVPMGLCIEINVFWSCLFNFDLAMAELKLPCNSLLLASGSLGARGPFENLPLKGGLRNTPASIRCHLLTLLNAALISWPRIDSFSIISRVLLHF
jgi:hypothetical protein